MELYIIRHGKTYWNNEKKIQGWADIELTESGRRVAYDSAEGMKDIHFDAIYSSPLKRAYETACILKGLSLIHIYLYRYRLQDGDRYSCAFWRCQPVLYIGLAVPAAHGKGDWRNDRGYPWRGFGDY